MFNAARVRSLRDRGKSRPVSGGYYDYTPTVTLARAVVFAGHPGSTGREIVYDLASLTGLPLHDLDRLIEHEAGQSLWSLVRERGAAALRVVEEELLSRALESQPSGLIVVGESALMQSDLRAQIQQRAGLVFFRLPAAACYWSLCRQTEERDGILGHPLLPDRLTDVADLRPLMAGLQPAVIAADRVVDLEHRGVHETVLDLHKALPQLGTIDEAEGR